MAAQPQAWIDESLALLEKMDGERDGLARALADIEHRIREIHHSVEHTDVQLDELEERGEELIQARRALQARHEEILRARDELWQRLLVIRNDRERVRAAERRLALDVAMTEHRHGDLPEELATAEGRRRDLEQKLVNLNALRRDVAMELAKLEVEMGRMVGQIERLAEAAENEEADERVAVPAPPRGGRLRLVTPDESVEQPIPPPMQQHSVVKTLRFHGGLQPDSGLYGEEEGSSAGADIPVSYTRETMLSRVRATGLRVAANSRRSLVAAGLLGGVVVLGLIAVASGGGNPSNAAAAAAVLPLAAQSSAASDAPVTVIPSAPVEPYPDELSQAPLPPVPAPVASASAAMLAVGADEEQPELTPAADPEPTKRPAKRRAARRSSASKRAASARPAESASDSGFKKVELRADDDPLAGL